MKLIRPIAVDDTVLINSSVAEDDYPAWDAGTSYPEGARIARNHRVYESAIGNNAGKDPATDVSGAWIDVGPTNRWAMFDPAAGPATTAAGPIVVTLAPTAAVSAVGIVDLSASSVRVQVEVGGATIYDETTDTAAATSWAATDLPAVAGQSIVVTAAGAQVTIGKLVIGTAIDLGQTETGPTIGITDYSRRDTDEFGVTTVVERAWAKELSLRTRLSSDLVDGVEQQLAAVRATAAMWIGEDGFESLTLYGFFKDFSIDLQLGATSFCSLTIEGLPNAPLSTAAVDPAVSGASDFQVIAPLVVDDGVLDASSVPENDYPAWSAVTVYATGDRVIKTATHRIYESLTDANTGNDPSTTTAWLDVGPTNRWAMFDQALGSYTTAGGSVSVTLVPTSAVDALAVLDTNATSVRVQAAGYDRTIALGVDDTAVSFLDLAVAAGGSIVVTIAADPAAVVSAGTLLLGALDRLGVIETSPTVGITDYSKKDTDDFGNTALIERAWAKRMAVKSIVASAAIDPLLRRVAALRATPALWIGQDGFSSLTIYGFFRDFQITVAETVSECSVTIEGLSKAQPVKAPAPVTVGWSNVTDDDGNKPDDNATVGAPAGTKVGDRPVEDLLGDLDTAKSDIADLFTTYGDTESAEQAKLDAQAARDAAADAQAAAEANAQTAAQKADAADGSATTASGQAAIATQKADDAGQSAINAAASSDTASTKAGEAGVSAQHAATSEANTLGYKNAAAASQTLAATNADAATLATAAAFPRDFGAGIQFWGNLTGSPQAQTQPGNWSNPYGGSAGAVLRITNPLQYEHVRPKNLISTSLAGRTIRITATVRLAAPTTSGVAAKAAAIFYGLGGDYQTIYYSGFMDNLAALPGHPNLVTLPVDGSIQTLTFQGRVVTSPVCPWIAPDIYLVSGDGSSMAGAQVDILGFVVEDVTESEAASDSASAAAQSESTAATSRDQAGNSAAAANQSKLDAQAANTNAQTAASNASGSAATATSEAAQASDSKALAAAYSSTRGLTPNGDFATDSSLWGLQNMTWAASYGSFFAGCVISTSGVKGQAFGTPIPVDTSRTYRLNVDFVAAGAANVMYAGLQCRDASGNVLAIVYIPACVGQAFSTNHYKVSGDFTGEPYTGTGNRSGTGFMAGTKSVVPIFLGNYSNIATAIAVLGSCFLEDVTDQANAAAQATVATNQAAIATAQASNASSSESTAAGYANDAKGYRDSSSSSATTATNQASVATAEAAAAQQSAVLAASVSVGAITLNPTFADWADGQPYPTAWGGVAGATKVAGENGTGNGYRLPGAANTQAYATGAATPAGSIVTNGYYVVEADFRLNAGTLVGAGVLFRVYNTSGTYDDNRIPFATDPSNNTGVALGNGVVGQTYRLRKMIKVATVNASYTVPFAMSHWSVMGSIAAANDITWYRCSVRAASDAEIKTGQIDALNASVTTNTGAIASIEDTAAYWETVAEASGGNPAKVRLYAGKNGSAIDLVSDVVAIQNEVDGTLMTVASFEGGQARLNDALVRNLHVAPRSDSDIYLAVQLKPLVFLASHGQVVQYQGGASFGVAPDRITVDTSSLPALDSGEAYDVRAISITDTQFTARIVKSTPSGTTIDQTAAGTNVGGTPQWRCNKADATNAYNGYYSFSVTATIPFFGAVNRGLDNAPDWRYSYQGSVDVYGYYGGAWHKLATITLSRSYTSDQGASVTITQSQAVYSDAAFGTGAQIFGVSPTSGAGTTINGFPGVSYSIRTASGETAVPGQLPFTVYPPPSDN